MRPMGWTEVRQFLLAGTRTATIATIGRGGHPHVVPVFGVLTGTTWSFRLPVPAERRRTWGATREQRFAWMMTRRHSDSSVLKGRLSSFHVRTTFSPGRRESPAAT